MGRNQNNLEKSTCVYLNSVSKVNVIKKKNKTKMRSLALNVETKNLYGIENSRIKVSIFFY